MDSKESAVHRRDIDGLRAIAILLVIIFHAFPTFLAGGFIGVDIFFVISGYFISGIILKSLENNSFSFIEFYKLRIKRIFPALILVLAVCLVVGWFTLFSGEYSSLGKHTAASSVFVSNIVLWQEADYFDAPSSLKPLLHLWALGVEEQFYLFWPLLLFIFYKILKKVPLGIFALLLLSLSLSLIIGQSDPTTAFYLPITRFWELMSGAILAYFTLFDSRFINSIKDKFKISLSEEKKNLILNTISVIGLLLIFLSVLIIDENNFYSGLVIISIVGSLFIIAAGQSSWINRKVLSNKILVFIGLISFPLYLWHWPIISFANIITSNSLSFEFSIILILISFILAWLTYELIEKPIRSWGTKKVVPILFVLLLVIGLVGFIVYANNGYDSRLQTQETVLKSVNQNFNEVSRYEISECREKYPQKFNNIANCYYLGDGNNLVFIIGDSHAAAIYMGYSKVLNERGYTVVNLGITGCNLLYSWSQNLTEKQKSCDADIKKVLEIVLSQNPRAVIISNNAWMGNSYSFEKGMNELLSYFPKDLKVIWFLQTPRLEFNMMRCVDRPFFPSDSSKKCSFLRADFDKMIEGMDVIVNKLKTKYPQLITLDPSEVLCNSTECFIILDNNFLYRDDKSHLSLFGSKYLSSRLPINDYFPILSKTN